MKKSLKGWWLLGLEAQTLSQSKIVAFIFFIKNLASLLQIIVEYGSYVS